MDLKVISSSAFHWCLSCPWRSLTNHYFFGGVHEIDFLFNQETVLFGIMIQANQSTHIWKPR